MEDDRCSNNSQEDNDQDEDDVVCCKHGKPCRLAEDNTTKKSKSAASKSNRNRRIYDNIPDLDMMSLRSNPRNTIGDEEDVTSSQITDRTADRTKSGGRYEGRYENMSNHEDIRTETTNDWSDDDGRPPSAVKQRSKNNDGYDNLPSPTNLLGGDDDVSTAREQEQDREDYSEDDEQEPKQPKICTRTSSQQKMFDLIDRRQRNESETTILTNLSQTFKDKINPKEQMTEMYLGTCTSQVAERRCKRGFRLYHRVADWLDSDHLQASLPLFIVFQPNRQQKRHIRVLRSSKGLLQVDLDGEPQFHSLGQLVTFYDIYASFENNMEPFPARRGRILDSPEDTL